MKFMVNIFENQKVLYLVISIIVFSFIYLILDDKHFGGLNQIQEAIKDEVLKKEVQQEVEKATPEPFINLFNNDKVNSNSNSELIQEVEKEEAIEEKTEDIVKDVKEIELDPGIIKPNIFQKGYDRMYFSVSTGCLLGFGDIYPITNTSKFVSMIQSIVTVILILS